MAEMDITASTSFDAGSSERSGFRKPYLFLLYSPSSSPSPRPYAVQRVPIPASRQYAIGRGPESVTLFAVPGDSCASRTHALLEVNLAAPSIQVRDANSRNGTFINRVRLAAGETRPLLQGDILRVGDSFFLWRVQEDEPDQNVQDVPELVGASVALAQLRRAVVRLGPDPASVLVLGETGTGKEVAVRALHRLSGRPGQHIAVNCAAVPENLAESLFFGHARGAFTGATAQTGYFLAADGGTLFLDEVGDLPLSMQGKLLRLLEERAVMPVGSTKLIACDVRLIAATNRDLEAAIRDGRFRDDLYARLTDVVLHLLPLRERREDILLLLEHASSGQLKPAIPADVIELLLCYHWPRNVREVHKIASHLRLFGPDAALQERLKVPAVVEAESRPVPRSAASSSRETDLAEKDARRPRKLAAPSKDRLAALMNRHRGVIQDVASELGCSRRQVGRWLDLYEIDRLQFRNEQEP